MVGGTAPNLARLLTRKFVTQIHAVSNNMTPLAIYKDREWNLLLKNLSKNEDTLFLVSKKAFLIIINKFYNPSFSFSQHLI